MRIPALSYDDGEQTAMDEILLIEDFFDHTLLDRAWDELKAAGTPADLLDEHGEHGHNVISSQLKLYELKTPALVEIKDKLLSLFDESVLFRELHYHTLHRSWTVHNDWTPPTEHGESYYNFLIPLHDVESRTVVFDQRSIETDRFNQYKKDHGVVKNPVPKDVWQEYLSMCWPQDRYYLSLKHIFPAQRKGQLIGFMRDLFHCSDNFHLKGHAPKQYIQIYIDKRRS